MPSNQHSLPRGGHAPTSLRRQLWAMACPNEATDSEDVITDARPAIGQLWNCTDIVPASVLNELGLPRGSTYAQVVRRIAATPGWQPGEPLSAE